MINITVETDKVLEQIQGLKKQTEIWKRELQDLSLEDRISIISRILKSSPIKRHVKRTFDLIQNKNIPKFQRAFKEWQEKILIPEEKKAIRKAFKRYKKGSFRKQDPGKIADTVTARIVSTMNLESIETEGLRIIKPGYTAAFVDGANGAYRLTGIQAQFDVLKPEAIDEINRIGGDLITEITTDQKLAIRSFVKTGIEEGLSMPQIAKSLEGTCGLHMRWRFAAFRYEMSLLARGLPQAVVDKKSRSYFNKLLRKRRLMIARTETAIAQSRGSLTGYKSIGVTKVRFYAAHGACPICASLDGTVYRIEESYGVIPVHPNGRCDWLAVSPKGGFIPPEKLKPPTSLSAGISRAISDIMAKYSRRKVEHCSALSRTGESFFQKSGTQRAVHFTAEEMARMRNFTEAFIHNHPIAASFSPQDLGFAQDINVGRMIICSEKFRYEIAPFAGHTWAPSIERQAAYEYRLLRAKYTRKADEIIAAHKGPLTQEFVDKLNDRIAIEHTQETIRRLVAIYGDSKKYKLRYKVAKVSTGG